MVFHLRLNEDQLREIQRRYKRAAPGVDQVVPEAPRARRAGTKRGPSPLELAFAEQLSIVRIAAPVREHRFLAERNFRLDFAWPSQRVAVEVQGMVHRIKGRFKADIEKRALALLAGWRVLEVSGAEIRSGQAIAWLIALLQARR
jgi:very-short-patch-repair endonuclease